MEPRELSIGGYYMVGDQVVRIDGPHQLARILTTAGAADEMHGVPITKNLVTKLGFQAVNNLTGFKHPGFDMLIFDRERVFTCYVASPVPHKMRFVHELQNIFYVLYRDMLMFDADLDEINPDQIQPVVIKMALEGVVYQKVSEGLSVVFAQEENREVEKTETELLVYGAE